MTKRGAAAVQEQSLFPMKDVTPKAKAAKVTGHVAPNRRAPDNPPSGGSSVKPPKPRKAKGTAVAIHKPQAPKEARNMLAIIAEAAANPAVNPENMRALLDMQKEIMAEQSRRDFTEALIALQAELPVIRQDGKIEIRAKDSKGERTGAVQQATPYATFNNIMAAIKPLLFKHGLGLTFSTEPVGERLLVKGLLQGHGYERTTSFPLPAETSGSKNNVQGWGSSLSYGKRYCTIALLNIVSGAAEDRDTDGRPGDFNRTADGGLVEAPVERPKINREQFIRINELLTDAKIPEKRFCERYGIASVNHLPAELYAAAEKAIADHKANAGAKRG